METTYPACEVNVDEVIDKLLEVRGSRPGRQVNLSEDEIKALCKTSRDVFMLQPPLLELEAPIKICGASPAVAIPWPHRTVRFRVSSAPSGPRPRPPPSSLAVRPLLFCQDCNEACGPIRVAIQSGVPFAYRLCAASPQTFTAKALALLPDSCYL